MDFLNAGALVSFRALGQGGEESAEIHPAGLAQEDGARWVVLVEEGAEEWVEVVGGGGEVEPGWGEGLRDVGVEIGHGGDGGGFGDEGGSEDADWGGGHGYFYGVVDVWGEMLAWLVFCKAIVS